MSALHLNPGDRPGARRVLAHLQQLLRESSGGRPSPTAYQATLQFVIDDLHESLRRRSVPDASRAHYAQPARPQEAPPHRVHGNAYCTNRSRDPLVRLALYLLWIERRPGF
jgi:hypothetical protein